MSQMWKTRWHWTASPAETAPGMAPDDVRWFASPAVLMTVDRIWKPGLMQPAPGAPNPTQRSMKLKDPGRGRCPAETAVAGGAVPWRMWRRSMAGEATVKSGKPAFVLMERFHGTRPGQCGAAASGQITSWDHLRNGANRGAWPMLQHRAPCPRHPPAILAPGCRCIAACLMTHGLPGRRTGGCRCF